MKVFFCIVFIAFSQIVMGQAPVPLIHTSQKDSINSILVKELQGQYDFIIGYVEESYWWSNKLSYKVFAKENDNWVAIQLTGTKNKKGRLRTERTKYPIATDSAILLLADLYKAGFWMLSNDSLNQEGVALSDSMTRKLQVVDGVNYKFEVLTTKSYRVIQSYEPDTYLEKFPQMRTRKTFIECRTLFLNTWKNRRS